MIGNSGRKGDPQAGAVHLHKWGQSLDIDVADAVLGQIIWPIKATVQQYLFIDVPIALTLQSSNVNDTAAGTGARTVKVQHHDNNGVDQQVVLALAGITPVPLPTTSYGVFRMSVESSGTGNTNAGQITIKNGASIYASIEIGEGKTQIAVVRCPNNKIGNINSHTVEYGRTGGNNQAFMRLRRRLVDGTILTEWDPALSVNLVSSTKRYESGFVFLPGEFIYWECVSVTANNTPIRGDIHTDFRDI